MTTENFLQNLRISPDNINFTDAIEYIMEHYDYTPVTFTNGIDPDRVINQAGTNEGSCKIFAFGKIAGLTAAETLACFGQYYRDEVLNDPNGDNHANIRSFIKYGWQGINFDNEALVKK
ncbi:MAG: HopJ type III effector protein [Gammaproteobacteria bacterium]|nr:HopJ type III effector protein [Gammaproteobacteria bacterium]MCW8910833.1 HopJ type III effector protein [Gammaproteobacteria bacterium]MCW9005040.1 HopJ type III effector protein [Gammaproteobacteria bacterium]MCW9056560.1 HopJ type III effector protein [Gammaproteobacteria bacterium]